MQFFFFFFFMSAFTIGAMMWPLWVTCHNVWGNAGSYFIQRLFSCFSPTLLAFAYTTFVLMMIMKMMTKNRMKRPGGLRSRTTPRLEKPVGLWLNHQQTQAEEKVCIISITLLCISVCFELNLMHRAEHARMLWWTASLVPWRLHPVAWYTSSTGWVCSGPCFALLRIRWVFTHIRFSWTLKIQPIVWLLLK